METIMPHYYVMPGLKERPQIDKYSKIPELLQVVCDYYKITTDEIRKRTRKQPICLARHICMYILRNNTNMSLLKIGQIFGGYDHTSVCHAHRFIQSQMSYDSVIRNDVNIILQKL